jgi:hypothetical protein
MTMLPIARYYETLSQVIRLPLATLSFRRNIDPENITETYRYYTKPHPRYKIIRHKTIGAALIDLEQINTLEKYINLIEGKNRGAFHAKRARSRGYAVKEIDRNSYIDAIHRINTSCSSRQGRPMDPIYQQKTHYFKPSSHFRYYGIVNKHGELVAYANLGLFGNFCAFSHLMGLRNNDGIMHLLIFEIISTLIEQHQVHYVMYDTFFGAQPGLRQFKTMLGFRPYRAKYILL